jgi:hypothetical protein
MSTPNYAAANTATHATLLQWIASNPNRNKGLDMPQKEVNRSSMSNLPAGAAAWMELNVSPPGPITALSLLFDPLFIQAAPGLRAQMLLEKRTALAIKIDNDMRSGKLMRMRRKMHEWLATDMSKLTAETVADVWDILCTVSDVQTICIEDAGGSGSGSGSGIQISFAPADVSLWHSDRPIHIVEKNLRKVWIYVGAPLRLLQSLLGWFSDMEEAGAKIKYPVSDKSKASLVEFLEVLPTWKESMRKQKKDELAVIAGRAATLELLSDWQQCPQLFCE